MKRLLLIVSLGALLVWSGCSGADTRPDPLVSQAGAPALQRDLGADCHFDPEIGASGALVCADGTRAAHHELAHHELARMEHPLLHNPHLRSLEGVEGIEKVARRLALWANPNQRE